MAWNARLTVKSAHNWLGLGSAAFLVVLLATGVCLNHPAALPGADREVLCVAVDPSAPGRLFRGGAQALELSTDGGASWAELPLAYAPLEVVSIAFRPGRPSSMAILQRWHGPLLSVDGGAVWEPAALPFDPLEAGVELRSLSFDRDGALYLHTSQGSLARGADGAWKSLDFDLGRKNWSRIVRTLHNGHFFGTWFVKVYDAASAALLLLIVTGVVLWRVKQS